LGERGPGSIVVTPGGRGPDGFYAGIAEADTFETWADVARHYRLDPDWTVVSGYSMGGFGVYRLLARYPDLFARGFSVVGAPGAVGNDLISLRNTPLLAWNVTADELVNIQTSEAAVTADAAAGLHFEEDLFLTADHLTLAVNDQFLPGAEFLGTYRVDRDPNEVSFAVDPGQDSARADVVADHAYWLSGLRTRGPGVAMVVALTHAFGTPPPVEGALARGFGALTGGEIPAMAYMSRSPAWTAAAHGFAVRNWIDITAVNLATMVIDVQRARVNCGVHLAVRTNGPLTVVLDGCGRTLHFR
jgi:pimeloyl-ACP methyl ester carboxylesterase